MTTRSELLNYAIGLQESGRMAKARQAEAGTDGANDYWLGVQVGLAQANRDIQHILAKG